MWRLIGMPRCTHVPNFRPFGQCLPCPWSWSSSFALHAMNLLPRSSYLWPHMWIIFWNSSFIILVVSRCETKALCQGFTFFWVMLNFYRLGQTLVNTDLPISCGLGRGLSHSTSSWFGMPMEYTFRAPTVFHLFQWIFGTYFAKTPPYSLQIIKSPSFLIFV